MFLQIVRTVRFDMTLIWIDSNFSGGYVSKVSPNFQSVHGIAKIKKLMNDIAKIKKICQNCQKH